ncbi:MAG: hypothetical protein M3R06_06160, partial [Chloroflexota bacterium]|nr:hypothetical protein [Chloroflexota bacterium]
VKTLRRAGLRLRRDRAIACAIFGTGLGLVAAISLAVLSRLTPLALPNELARWSVISGISGCTFGAVAGFVWPAPIGFVARRADQACNLRERLSTALELSRDASSSTLGGQQVADTDRVASGLRSIPRLGPQIARRELGILAGLLVFLVVGIWAPNPRSADLRERRASAAEVEAAKDEILALRMSVLELPDLDEESRAALDTRLADLAERLDPGDLTQTEAQAEIAAAEEDIKRLEDSSVPERVRALQRSAPELQTSGATADIGNALAAGDISAAAEALAELGESAKMLSPEEQQALAARLAEMAALQSEPNPEIATALEAAAASLAAGDTTSAAAALAQAGAATQSLASSAAAGEAAAAAAAGLNNVRQQLASSQSGASAAASGTPGSGQAGQAGQPGQGNLAGSGTGAGAGSGAGAGAGTGGGAGAAQPPNQQTTAGGTSSNNQLRQGETGQTGTRDRESVYAPAEFNASQGDPDFIAGREQSTEQQSGARPGQGVVTAAAVPYDEVYGTYAREAGRDIEQGAVPPALRNYVRDYFSALEPESEPVQDDENDS